MPCTRRERPSTAGAAPPAPRAVHHLLVVLPPRHARPPTAARPRLDLGAPPHPLRRVARPAPAPAPQAQVARRARRLSRAQPARRARLVLVVLLLLWGARRRVLDGPRRRRPAAELPQRREDEGGAARAAARARAHRGVRVSDPRWAGAVLLHSGGGGTRGSVCTCAREGRETGMREGDARREGEGEYKTREEGFLQCYEPVSAQYLLRRLRRSVKHAQHVVKTPRNRHANAATVSHVPVS